MAVSFEKTAIVGLGLIGGSLAAAFKRKKVSKTIIGVDNESVISQAKQKKLINEGFEQQDLQKAIKDADLIILAAPINEILKHLNLLPKFVKPGVLITDVGSTKELIIQTAERHLPAGVFFLGGHPMAGSEKRGLEHSDHFLFENAVYVLVKSAMLPDELAQKYVEMVQAIGAHVLFLSPKEHDEIAAVVSHLPQMLAVTLMNYAAKLNSDNPAYLKLGAGGFRDMTRVASSPFDIWANTCETNAGNIQHALDQFIAELSETRNLLAAHQLQSAFETAARSRLSIPKDTRGFMRRHFDISVIVEDRPGVIATIATLLAQAKINIKDIEILKIREGEGGTMRLAFESELDREAAMKLLDQNNFEVTKR